MSEIESFLSGSSTELESNATTTLPYQRLLVTNMSMQQNNAAPPRRERLAHRCGALAGDAVWREQQPPISYDTSCTRTPYCISIDASMAPWLGQGRT